MSEKDRTLDDDLFESTVVGDEDEDTVVQFFEVDEPGEALRRGGVASEMDRARIRPWAQLQHDEFLIEEEKLADLAQRRILRNLEAFGICLVRMMAHEASKELVQSIIDMLGTPTEWQNLSKGTIKDIRPQSDISPNTGDSKGDLGFHVDGTQSLYQPPVLLFQYATGATMGAHSKFADAAKIIRDIPEDRRWEILRSLSASDAASFRKGEQFYRGPMFSYSPSGSLMCRVRFDPVMQVRSDLQSDFAVLRERFEDPYYPSMFQPRDGDVILFDNWRIMHARTEVLGTRQRHHRRVWFANLKLEHQVKYQFGIRPVPIPVAAEIMRRSSSI